MTYLSGHLSVGFMQPGHGTYSCSHCSPEVLLMFVSVSLDLCVIECDT